MLARRLRSPFGVEVEADSLNEATVADGGGCCYVEGRCRKRSRWLERRRSCPGSCTRRTPVRAFRASIWNLAVLIESHDRPLGHIEWNSYVSLLDGTEISGDSNR